MNLVLGGTSYSLAHLAPIERRIEVPLRGGLKKTLLVEFRFSCHCYSRGPSQGEAVSPQLRIADGSRQMPRDRIFDPRRYALSHQLVTCIDVLIEAQGTVHRSRHDNFFRIDTLQESANGVLTPVSYYIFMSARKVAAPGQTKRIKIYVESAYPALPAVPAPASVQELPFRQVLGKIWAP
jgi:hypothetical protein